VAADAWVVAAVLAVVLLALLPQPLAAMATAKPRHSDPAL